MTARLYTAIIAASDTDANMRLAATALCDGTNDETEINTAISNAASGGVPWSILVLPGTYQIGAAVDFTPLTAMGGIWGVFEATATTWIAAANMTTMVKIDPGAGGQIVTCADIRLGKLDGNDTGGKTVTQIVNMARFNDNFLFIQDVYNGSGNGVTVAMAGVGDYPCANNHIDIGLIHNCAGTAFHVTGTAHPDPFGFQGNLVTLGDIIANGNGVILGGAANQNASYNQFRLSAVEWNTGAGIYDYCGGNIWTIANTNSNTNQGIGAPNGVTLPSTIFTNSEDTIDAAVTNQFFVLNKGRLVGQS